MNVSSRFDRWIIPLIVLSSATMVLAIIAAMVVLKSFFGLYTVSGPSMNPTLCKDDLILIRYHIKTLERGDIVVFHYPRDPKRHFIQRVIALPNDTIEIKNAQVFINGQLQTEPYILGPTRGSYPLSKVPEGHFFLMGDNRNNSEDSRFKKVGFVPYDLVIGKTAYVMKSSK